jgi:drug/metabolite transporter (DMT)-like permease
VSVRLAVAGAPSTGGARELSIVLSAVIGSVWLDEGPLAPLLLGSGAVLAGVACIATA